MIKCRHCGKTGPDCSTYPYLGIATKAGWKIITVPMCVDTRTAAHTEYECPECQKDEGATK